MLFEPVRIPSEELVSAAAQPSNEGQRREIPLVPIAMSGGHEAMPVGAAFPKVGSEVFLFIGKPMYALEGEEAEHFMDRAFHAITMMLEQGTPHPVEEDGSSPFDPPAPE